MSDLVWTLHTVSGAVARVPQHLLGHPVFGEYLVEVEPHAKSYEPELWKPTTVDEYKNRLGNSEQGEVIDHPIDSEHEE